MATTSSSKSSSPTISQSSYNAVVAQAAKQGISAATVANTLAASGAKIGSTNSGTVSMSGQKAMTSAAGQGVNYNSVSGTYSNPNPTVAAATNAASPVIASQTPTQAATQPTSNELIVKDAGKMGFGAGYASDAAKGNYTSDSLTKAQQNWDAKGYKGQQEFLKQNPTFKPQNYGFKMATEGTANTTQQGTTTPLETIKQAEEGKMKTTAKTDKGTISAELGGPDINHPSYTDDSAARQTEIQNNLDVLSTQSTGLFKDPDTFRKAFHYYDRSNEEKATLDKWWGTYKAKKDFEKKSAQDIADMNLPTEGLDFLKNTDQTKYDEVMRLMKEKNDSIKAESTVAALTTATDGKKDTDMDKARQKIVDDAAKAIADKEAAKKDPALEKLNSDLLAAKATIDQTDQDLARIRAEVVAAHPGVPTALLNSIVADKSYVLNDVRSRAAISFNQIQGEIKYKTDRIEEEYKDAMAMVDIENKDFANQLDLLKTNRGIKKDIFSMGMEEKKYELEKSSAKSQTVTNPISGLSYEKQPDGSWKAIDFGGTSSSSSSSSSSSGYGTNPPAAGYRTDRSNNPVAMTTDVAKQAGLVEGVDYVQGDPFTTASGKTLYTAKLLGDGVDKAIKAIDKIGFTTKAGGLRRTYTDKIGLNNEKRAGMTYDQKKEAIKQMYKQEGGSGSLFGEGGTQRQYTSVETSAIQSYLKDPTEKNYNQYLVPNGLSKEDANLYKQGGTETLAKGYNPDDAGVYKKYLSGGATKTDYEQFGGKDNLSKQAAAWYKDSINSRFSNASINVNDVFMDYYKNQSAAQQVKIDEGIGEVGSIVGQVDDLLDYLETNGVPSSASIGPWTKYMTKVRALQMSAKSENIFNLGVLNGPDLDVLNSIIPAGRGTVLALTDDEVKEAMIQYRDYLVNNFNRKGAIKGMSYNYTGKYPKGTFDNNVTQPYGEGSINQEVQNAENALFGK